MFLLFATGINSRGEIVGFGLTSTFDAHAFWRPRATAKTTARPLRLPHKAGPVKAGRALSLKMFASCFSSDCPSAGSEPGSWGRDDPRVPAGSTQLVRLVASAPKAAEELRQQLFGRANSEISIPWSAAPIVLLEYSAQPASSGLSYGWKCSTLAKPASTCRASVATLVSKALAGCGIDTAACRAAFAFSSG